MTCATVCVCVCVCVCGCVSSGDVTRLSQPTRRKSTIEFLGYKMCVCPVDSVDRTREHWRREKKINLYLFFVKKIVKLPFVRLSPALGSRVSLT